MNKKVLKKWGPVFVVFTILSLGGCEIILEQANIALTKHNNKVNLEFRENAEEDAVKQMKEKYGIEFKAHDSFREQAQFSDAAIVWMHPANNPEVKFQVNLDDDGKAEFDNFISMKVNHEINNIMKEKLPPGVEMSAIIYSWGDSNKTIVTNPNVTLQEYNKVYNPEYFSGYMIVKDTGDVTPEMFEEAFKEVYKATTNRMFQANVHFVPEEKYEDCYKKFTERLYTNSGFFYDYDTEKMGFQVNGKGFFHFEE